VIVACVLGFLSGLVALSYEILWYRTYSFVTASRADAFALMLGSYLGGLSLGALAAGIACRRGDASKRDFWLRVLLGAVLVSNAISYLLAPAVARAAAAGMSWQETIPGVAVAAGGMGLLLPLIGHFSIAPDSTAGARVSYLYLANILGSTSGSLLTGFVMLELYSLAATSVVLACLGLVMAAVLLWNLRSSLPGRICWTAALVLLGVGVSLVRPALFDGFYERLQLKREYTPGYHFTRVLETRGGVVTIDEKGRIHGGGIYDGAFNTSLRQEINHIERAYFLQAVHASPKEVLMIGLSSGSWATVIAAHPGVEHLTIVEINPGYLKLIPEYPMVADLLRNPKVTIVIDDGRRWLRRNPQRKFDAVVANATFHWRANSSNLLSTDFLRLIRSHLLPGGLVYYNATSSPEVLRTAASEFPYALQVMGFVMVSDSPIRYDMDSWKRALATYPIDQRPPFDLTLEADRAVIEKTARDLGALLVDRDSILRKTEGARLVTDDNMGTEWRVR
jgi:spermidine synthase